MKLRNYTIYIVAFLFCACSPSYTLQSYEDKVIEIQAIEDSTVLAIIAPYQNAIEAEMNEVLSFTKTELNKNGAESTLGNFVTDLCLNYTNAHMCVMNNGGLRSTLPQGKITRGKIYELMPFENELVILELNTLELFDLIEYILLRGGEPLSGLSVYSIDSCMVNSSKNILYRQEDNILMSVPVIASSCGGEEEVYIVSEIKETYKIRVLTSDYLANGGDKMSFFNNKNQLKVGLKIRDAIINYCKSEQTISSKLDGRITKHQNE